MNRDLIINQTPNGVEIALLEDKTLVEVHHELQSNDLSVGDIYLGKIKRLVPDLNAAFVEIGADKDAFLHYTDLGPQVHSLLKFVEKATSSKQALSNLANFELEPEIVKTGKIEDVLGKKKLILVQILKEPISSKGPRLSCEINFAGRFIVLTPFNDGVSVSKKIISKEERKRLQRLGESIKPKNFGLIIRTAAEGKKVAELHEDIQNQIAKWENIFNALKSAVPPEKILSEMNKTSGMLRDLLNDSFTSIVVNDRIMTADIKHYISEIAPEKEKIVSNYDSRIPIFDHYGVTKQIKLGFGKTVNMPSGAYLIIEPTEALHVIDVNSGHKINTSNTQETNAVTVNLEAINEIARQIRLRDLGGIIIIDFIDMKDPENKKMISRRMREIMENDRAKHTVLPLSKFGLMQITRQRTRPEIKISTLEQCPTCNGTGKAKATLFIIDEIESNLSYLLNELDYKGIKLFVHPFIASYLKQGFISKQWRWFWKFKKWIKIYPENNYHITQYECKDTNNEDIKL